MPTTRANRGGGVYLAAAGDLDLAGVTIAGNRASLDINSTAGNGNGGGIYATRCAGLTGGVLRENVARISGGGLYATDLADRDRQRSSSATLPSRAQMPRIPKAAAASMPVMTATVTGALFQGNAAAIRRRRLAYAAGGHPH